MSIKINDAVLGILSKVTVEGNVIYLTCGQLDRKQYLDVNKVLETMGGKWDKKVKGHVFAAEPTDKLEAVLLTGEYDKPDNHGYFPTPPVLVDGMIALAGIEEGMVILEPSAGQGAIADKLADIVGKGGIHCYELQEANCDILTKKGYLVECCDWLKVEVKPIYDRVVMNPPFAKQQDIEHVEHALGALKAGGRLVSIMSSGVTFRQNKKTLDFLKRIEGHSEIIPNPENSFKLSGTCVNTITLVVNKNY